MSLFGFGEVAAAGINAAASTAQTWANINFQKKENTKNRQHDFDMAEQNFNYGEQSANNAWDKQVDMWNMNNEYNKQMWNENNDYNSASAQKQRLVDAGLNPALMNGGSAATSNPTQSQTPAAQKGSGGYGSSSSQQAPRLNISNPLDDAMRIAQIKLTNAQTAKVNEETSTEYETRQLVTTKFQNEFWQYQFNLATEEDRIALVGIEKDLLELQKAIKTNEKNRTDLDLEILRSTKSEVIESIKKNLEILSAQETFESAKADKAGAIIFAEIVSTYAGAAGDIMDSIAQFLPAGWMKKLGGMFTDTPYRPTESTTTKNRRMRTKHTSTSTTYNEKSWN